MRTEKLVPIPEWLHPLSLVRTVWKRKFTFGAIAAVLITGTIFAVLRLPAIYKSDAVVLVDSQKIPDRYVASSVNPDVGDRLATISQQILSSERLKKIIKDYDLYSKDRQSLTEEEILEQIRKDIEIKIEKGWTGNRPGAFRIGYRGPTPDVVAAVANRIANLFVDENLHTRELQAEGTSEFFVAELDRAKVTLDQLEVAVSKYKIEHNGQLPQQESALMSRIASLQTQSQANQDGINRAQQTKVTLENELAFYEAAESAGATAASEQAQRPPGTKPDTKQPDSNEAAIAALEDRIESMRSLYTDQYPELRLAIAELARLREKSQVAIKNQTAKDDATKESVAAGPAPRTDSRPRTPKQIEISTRIANIKSQLKLTSDELESRTAEQASIRREIAAVEARVEGLPVREQEMAGLLRDYEISKANYKSLLDKKIAADMATEMERRQKAERFTIVDPARVPEKPISPNRPLLISLGGLISVALAFSITTAQDFKSGAILGEWELPPDTVVLGRVPRIDTGGQSGRSNGDSHSASTPDLSDPSSAQVALSSSFLRVPWVKLRRSSRHV